MIRNSTFPWDITTQLSHDKSSWKKQPAKLHCHLNSVPKGEPTTSGLQAFLSLLIITYASSLFNKSVRPEKPGLLQDQEAVWVPLGQSRTSLLALKKEHCPATRRQMLQFKWWARIRSQHQHLYLALPALYQQTIKTRWMLEENFFHFSHVNSLGYSWWYLLMKNTCQALCSSHFHLT